MIGGEHFGNSAGSIWKVIVTEDFFGKLLLMPNPGPLDGHVSKASCDLGGSSKKLSTSRGVDVRGGLARDRLRVKLEERKKRKREEEEGKEEEDRIIQRKRVKKSKNKKRKKSKKAQCKDG